MGNDELLAALAGLVRQENDARSTEMANPADAPSRPQIPSEMAQATSMRGRLEPLSADRFGVHFTADAEFRDLLEEVRALASHGQPKGEILPLMKRALEAYRSELRKSRFWGWAKAEACSAWRGLHAGSVYAMTAAARSSPGTGDAVRRGAASGGALIARGTGGAAERARRPHFGALRRGI